jgi:molecular chaperone GrpE
MTKKPNVNEELLQQIADLTDALQRERADAMNVRRRSDEERAKMAGFYKSLVVRELLPTIDNFERALKHAPGVQQVASSKQQAGEQKLLEWVEGVKKIVSSFEGVLAKIGVQRIKAVGEPFNPNLHEAVSMEEGEGDQEIVSEELQSGYTLGEEVIRHAMVRVKNQN